MRSNMWELSFVTTCAVTCGWVQCFLLGACAVACRNCAEVLESTPSFVVGLGGEGEGGEKAAADEAQCSAGPGCQVLRQNEHRYTHKNSYHCNSLDI